LSPYGYEIPYIEATQQMRNVIAINQLGGNMAYTGKPSKYLFDIVILEVDVPFILNKQVIPAKLPSVKTPVGTNLIVSGWGATSEGTTKN
jgi:Trypsin